MSQVIFLPDQWRLSDTAPVARSSLNTSSICPAPPSGSTAVLITGANSVAAIVLSGNETSVTIYGAVLPGSGETDPRIRYMFIDISTTLDGANFDNFSASPIPAPTCDGVLLEMQVPVTGRPSSLTLRGSAAGAASFVVFNATAEATEHPVTSPSLPPSTSTTTSIPTSSSVTTPPVPQRSSNTALIMGVAIPLVLIALCAMVGWCVIRRRRRRRQRPQSDTEGGLNPYYGSAHSTSSTPPSESKGQLIVESTMTTAVSPTALTVTVTSPSEGGTEDARVGAAVLSGVRSAGFSLQDLLASLDRLRGAAPEADTEELAPPPMYDSRRSDAARRSTATVVR